MYHEKGKKRETKKALHKELLDYDRRGIELRLNGELSSPKKIAKACQVAENSVYMRDYVLDKKGVIKAVSFDLISRK